MTTITTAHDLVQRLNHTFDPDKPILIDTGDGIYGVNLVSEEPNEIIIYLGKMP